MCPHYCDFQQSCNNYVYASAWIVLKLCVMCNVRLEDDYELISSPPEGSTHRACSIPQPPTYLTSALNISPPVAPVVRHAQVGAAEEEEGGVYEIISGDN